MSTDTRPYKQNEVLIVDDEPMYLEWMRDYIQAKGIGSRTLENADAAIAANAVERFRAYVIDLNMPVSETALSRSLNKPLEASFPGLTVARAIRSSGVSSKRVLIYSVHMTEQLFEEVSKLDCQYILKGRPKLIKEALNSILAFDPLAANP